MRLKSAAVLVALICLFLLEPVAAPRPSNGACELPKDLQVVVAKKYPGSEVVKLSDLEETTGVFFREDHGDACPGLAKVDFYGDGKLTLALALLTKNEQREKYKTKLVLAREAAAGWETTLLDSTGGTVPVIWSEGPGVYNDVYGTKEIHASHAVIVFCGYESWAIVYAWMNNKVDKVWIRD
jgi:hypothetical protein